MTQPPDYFVDIRVRVPHGHTISAPECHIMAIYEDRMNGLHRCTIEAVHPAIDRKPHTFEPGKTYTTRAGHPACIERIREDGALEGWIEFNEGRTKVCWYGTGEMLSGKNDPLNLVPAAPGPREVHEVEYEPAHHENATDRIDKLEAQATDLFRQLRGVRQRAEEARQHIESIPRYDTAIQMLEQRISRVDGKGAEGYEDPHERLDRLVPQLAIKSVVEVLAARIAKMAEEQAVDVQQSHQRMDSIASRVTQAHQFLETHSTRIDDVNKRVDKTDRRIELLVAIERLTRHKGTFSLPEQIELDGPSVPRFERKLYNIAYDGFQGFLIGRYTTIAGEPGVVLQQPDTKIVHVYKAKHIEGQ